MSMACILLEEVREEEHLQDGKHNEEFYADDEPERPPECHRAEAIVIEVEGASKEAFRVHNRHKDRYFVASSKLFH